jgi:predicted enzyme related to lactoylglutathione lyase
MGKSRVTFEWRTGDAGRLERFYGELLGWRFKGGRGGPSLEVSVGGEALQAAVRVIAPSMASPTGLVPCIEVEAGTDLEARAVALGAQLVGAPSETAEGRYTLLRDPDANLLALYAPTSKRARKEAERAQRKADKERRRADEEVARTQAAADSEAERAARKAQKELSKAARIEDKEARRARKAEAKAAAEAERQRLEDERAMRKAEAKARKEAERVAAEEAREAEARQKAARKAQRAAAKAADLAAASSAMAGEPDPGLEVSSSTERAQAAATSSPPLVSPSAAAAGAGWGDESPIETALESATATPAERPSDPTP